MFFIVSNKRNYIEPNFIVTPPCTKCIDQIEVVFFSFSNYYFKIYINENNNTPLINY